MPLRTLSQGGSCQSQPRNINHCYLLPCYLAPPSLHPVSEDALEDAINQYPSTTGLYVCWLQPLQRPTLIRKQHH